MATTFLAFSSSFMVKLPVPGPISRTTSVGLRPALSTIDCTTRGFFRMCWPLDLWNSMPARVRTEGACVSAAMAGTARCPAILPASRPSPTHPKSPLRPSWRPFWRRRQLREDQTWLRQNSGLQCLALAATVWPLYGVLCVSASSGDNEHHRRSNTDASGLFLFREKFSI